MPNAAPACGKLIRGELEVSLPIGRHDVEVADRTSLRDIAMLTATLRI
jgi:hypothetical protein